MTWAPKYSSLGPPSNIKPRAYHPTLEFLETQANKACVADYEQDIYNYLSLVELKSSINCSMIDLQPEIQWYMRPYLLDFLVEIHQSFRLHPQTLFLAINIIDKYCSKRVVFKRHYQLVGCTALWLAAKYEDKKSRVPTLKELTLMCRDAYDAEMFVQMERHILSTLEWCLVHTSLEDTLQISLKSSIPYLDETPKKIGTKNYHGPDLLSKIETLARFFCELSLYERNFIQFSPSFISLSAHLLASRILGSESAVESYEAAVNKFLSNNQEIDDDETFDEDLENSYPQVTQPFLSGFDEQTVDQILHISILLLNQFSTCSHALQNKYKNQSDNVNYFELVSRFIQQHQNLIKTFPETADFNDLEEEKTLSTQLRYTVCFIIGLTSEVQPPSFSYQHPSMPHLSHLHTPPSASSTISSVFSSADFHNYSASSINLTPLTSISNPTSVSSPIDSNRYVQFQTQQTTSQLPRNIFNQTTTTTSENINTHQSSESIIFKKPHLINDPEYGNHKRRSVYIHQHDNDNDEDKEMVMNDPTCPSSSPLAQRSQNKLNMMV